MASLLAPVFTENVSTEAKSHSASILLRDYQTEAVDKSLLALERHGNTLLVAPTGAGKTIMLSSVIDRYLSASSTEAVSTGKALVLQHRTEILAQNLEKLRLVSPGFTLTVVDAGQKDFSGDVVFSMVQTLAKNLEAIPYFDLVVVDEAHHIAANTYKKIISQAKSINPDCKVFGVTATPTRGDKKSIGKIFTNVCHEIKIHSLISSGHLVKPRTFVIDIGLQGQSLEFSKLHKNASDSKFDSFTAELLMKSTAALGDVVAQWVQIAKGRKTVFFTPNIKVSQELAERFTQKGIGAESITCELSGRQREELLSRFQEGDVDVLCNTMILTEGWDCPNTSCIALLKTSCFKSTYLQMVGRGLRSHPGKEDCLILDFGGSSFLHGTLEQDIEEAFKEVGRRKKEIEKSHRTCPNCGEGISKKDMVCPNCQHELKSVEQEKALLQDLSLVEMSFFQQTQFRFERLTDDLYSVHGFNRFSLVARVEANWYTIGCTISKEGKELTLRRGQHGTRFTCFNSAQTFMERSSSPITKKASWANEPYSQKQAFVLRSHDINGWMSKYRACCWINYLKYKTEIDAFIFAFAGDAVATRESMVDGT